MAHLEAKLHVRGRPAITRVGRTAVSLDAAGDSRPAYSENTIEGAV